MLGLSNLLLLLTFIFWSCCSLNGVISDPQTNVLQILCRLFDPFFVTNASIFNDNLNATFQDIKEQISDQNKHFATAQLQRGGESPILTLFQCRNYLPIADCAACLQIRRCITAVAPGAHVVYDGCFLRYNSNGFFDETTQPFNFVSCGNQTTGEATIFTTTVRQVLKNLQITTPKIPSFSAATTINVPNNNNGTTIYAFAQCTETITANGCNNCLKGRYIIVWRFVFPFQMEGLLMLVVSCSFFNDRYTVDITPMRQKGSGKKGFIIGGVVGGATLVLILLALFAWIRRSKRNKRVPS